MSQGHTKDSQKTPKDNGICFVCWSTFKIQRATGHIHRHGPRDNPCLGSDRPPASSSTSMPSCSRPTTQRQSSPPGTVHDSTVSGHQSSVRGLSHPPWVRPVSRIPLAARPSCRDLLTKIISKIVNDPNDKPAWKQLLFFCPVILAKPKRGRATRNLSSVINRRVQEWNNDREHTVQPQTNTVSGGKKSENSTLAAAVTSKLEAGNFKAAVRIICSTDTPCNLTKTPGSYFGPNIQTHRQIVECLVTLRAIQ